MLVQGVEQAVGEAPEEEEDGDEGDGVKRLANRHGGRARARPLAGAQRVLGPEFTHHGSWRGGSATVLRQGNEMANAIRQHGAAYL